MSKPSAEKYREELIAYLEGYPKNGTKEAVALTRYCIDTIISQLD